MIQRLAKKYNASIAEIDSLDKWNESVLGVSCVSNDKRVCESTLRKILDDIEMVDGLELDAYEEEYL